jgi:hypothetical protein
LYYTYDWLQEKNFGYSSGWKTLAIGSLTSANNFSLAFGVDVSGNPSGSFTGNGNEYFWRNTGSFKTPNAINNGYNQLFEWSSGGLMTFNYNATFSNGLFAVNEVRVANSGYIPSYNTSLRSIAGAIGVLQLGNNNDNYILAGNTNTGGYLIFRVNCITESITSGTEALRLNANATASFSSRVNVNGAADDADIALQTIAPSGAG